MAVVKCPSCGTTINVVEKKTGLWWGIGCLIATFALPVIVAVIGIIAAIAIPSFVHARNTSQHSACVANMRMLAAAKDQLAREKDFKPGDVITEQAVSTVLSRPLESVKCPKGGHYTLNPAGQDPACSVHGTLSQASRWKPGTCEPAVAP